MRAARARIAASDGIRTCWRRSSRTPRTFQAASPPASRTPASEAEVAALHAVAPPSVLPIGAQSSLTGGATPRGEVLLSTARLNRDPRVRRRLGSRAGRRHARRSRCRAGGDRQALSARADVHRRLRRRHRRHQRRRRGDVQVRDDARLGAGADGGARRTATSLDIERGRTLAHADGFFEIVLSDRTVRVPVPRYRMPDVPKMLRRLLRRARHGPDRSVHRIGRHARRDHRGRRCACCRRGRGCAWPSCRSTIAAAALAFVTRLRDAARETWRTRDPRGMDVVGDRAHGRALPGAAARGRRRPRQRRRRSRRTPRSRCWSRWSCRRT